jgi:uncharacterized membrane protein
MNQYWLDWLNLAIRWAHLVVGIAWIGSSFYFNWLESKFRPPPVPRERIKGEAWLVHGGGFYRVEKFAVAPERLPEELHWFKWEAYSTWLTGILLLILVYYLQADLYLVDPAVLDLPPWVVALLGVLMLAGGWVVYDGLCRSPLAGEGWLFALLLVLLLAAAAFLATSLFSGRGAFIHVGAMIGTIMVANVLMVIIPNQKRLVRATERGDVPDARLGEQAKLRSLHNNYLTLPVLFTMISNHYPMTYTGPWNWLILLALAAIGGGVRHFFNLRNRGRIEPWILPGAALAMLALALLSAPGRRDVPGAAQAALPVVGFAQAHAVIEQRCTPCHAARPSFEGFDEPPKNIVLDTPEAILRQAALIEQQAVRSEAMPLGNATEMTPDERLLLARWIEAGAPGPVTP